MAFLGIGIVPCKASHIFGADFYYEYVSGTNYKVSMAFYGDCSGTSFPTFATAAPAVQLMNGNTVVSAFNLQPEGQGQGVEVTPVCASEKNNTTCNGGTIPGVTRFIYSAVVSVPSPSASWHFYFGGNMSSSQAGRSNSITNLLVPGSGGSVMVLNADLNNLSGPNSSPRFTTIPTPFYCINIPQQYNPGAVDANNDSLAYELAPALEAGGPAAYRPGFSPTQPLATAAGSFSFNNVTGQLNFTPNITQNAAVVSKVVEYRNGVTIGSATREMTFVVLANCSANQPPTGTIDTTNLIQGGLFGNPTTFNVCEGTAGIRFPVRPVDPDGDTINVTVNGLAAGAVATITDNNTPHPLVVFNWSGTSNLAPGNYTFFLTFRDNGCPTSSQQTQAYNVRVVRASDITYRTIYPTECAHKAYISYRLSDGLLPRNVVVRQGATVIRTFTDNTGTYQDSLAEGTYTVDISSPNLICSSHVVLTVKDSGIYPYPPVITDAFYCKDDVPVMLSATAAASGSVIWFDSLNNRLSAPPVPATATAGIFTWYATLHYKVCESLRDTGKVYVTKRPVADFSITPAIMCDRDTAAIVFTGSVGEGPIIDYRWAWSGANSVTGQQEGPFKVHWPIPGTKTVTLQVLENKCPSDTAARSLVVKPTPVADFLVKDICQYDTMLVTYTASALPGQQYTWNFDGADLPQSTGSGPFRLHWPSGGIKHIYLSVSKDGCTDTASRFPEVFPIPEARVLNTAGVTCLGDKIYLEHAGSDAHFTWLPKDKIYYERDGRPYTFTLKPTRYTLIVSNEQGCVDSDAVTYDRIEPCCNFGYPTAFTPNGDGKNDEFRIVTYGNDADFSLSIYNRWGQRVYHSGNPKEGWDGRSNGKDCEVGTYYYVLQAKCLTGHEEAQKGEFTLIR